MANPLSIVFKKVKKHLSVVSKYARKVIFNLLVLRSFNVVGWRSSLGSRNKKIRWKEILSSRLNRDSRMTLLRHSFEGRDKKLFLFLLVIGLVTAGITLFPKNKSEASWYNDNWHYRKLLTIDHAQVSGLLATCIDY